MSVNDGYHLWLDYRPLAGCEAAYASYARYLSNVRVIGDSPVIESAARELDDALGKLFGAGIRVRRGREAGTAAETPGIVAGRRDALLRAYGKERVGNARGAGFRVQSPSPSFDSVVISGATDADTLYGVFRFLRFLQTGTPVSGIGADEAPAVGLRMLNHWDNPDGIIERGYAGASLWKWDELPDRLDPRYADYARACASVAINAAVLNNVNASALILETANLRKTAALADVFRAYGISVFLSANFAAPIKIGALATADPLDPSVIDWWKTKADEIYSMIPDFGGFLVKADSEGQPGPFAYGRTHADGANMLAAALAPHGGTVIWRAFVYGHGETDRAKKAYAQFKPHDGDFAPNAALQVKNGPIDFQPREPASPLFGGMERTRVFMEFQITQEYLGQGNHLVYLAPMWKEILDFDTRANGPGTPVSKTVSGFAAVANTGDDRNWCGHFFHAANWYAYGRLAWNPAADPDQIAREWIACTWGGEEPVREAILSIMRGSWETCVDYMTPLGLHHIMKEGHHYGPDPGDESAGREDWRPTYYHRASRTGLGFDRTRRTGSGAVDQYHPPVSDIFNDPFRCPEKYLLWFHHVPWTQVLSSGRALIDEIEFRYRRGVAAALAMREAWRSLAGKIDAYRHARVLERLDIQVSDAREWERVCVPYFRSFTDLRSTVMESVMRTDEHHVEKHAKLLETAMRGGIDVVFLGDSLTRRWEDNAELWMRFFGKFRPANFGVGADRLENIRWRILNGELDGFSAKGVVLLAGTNNLADTPPEEIARGIGSLIRIIREKQPDAWILALGLFPRDRDEKGVEYRESIGKVNALLPSVCAATGASYADVGPALLAPDGSIDRTIMEDGLHLNRKGYEKLGPLLAALIEKAR